MLCRAQPHFSNRMIPESPKRKKVRPLNINGRMVRLKFKKTAAVLAQGIKTCNPRGRGAMWFGKNTEATCR